jgi:hypothetical protein
MDLLLMDTQKILNTLTTGLMKETFIRKDREFTNEKLMQRDAATMQSIQVRLTAEASDKVYDPNFAHTSRGIRQYVSEGNPKEAAYAIFLLERLITHNKEEAIQLFYSFGEWKDKIAFGLTPKEYKRQLEIAQKEEDMSIYNDACIIYGKIAKAYNLIGSSITNEITLDSTEPKILKKAIEVILLSALEQFGESNAIGLKILREMQPSRVYLSKKWPKIEVQTRGNEGIRKFKLTSVSGTNKWDAEKVQEEQYDGDHQKDQLMRAAQYLCYGVNGIAFVPKINEMNSLSNEEIIQLVNKKLVNFMGGKGIKSLLDSIRKNVVLLKLEMSEKREDFRAFLSILERSKDFEISTKQMIDSINDEIRILVSDQPDMKDLLLYVKENPESMSLIGYSTYQQAESEKTPQDLVMDYLKHLSTQYKKLKEKGDTWQEMGFEVYLSDMIDRGVDSLHKPLFTFLFRDSTDVFGQEDFDQMLNEVLEKGASNLMGSLNFSIQQVERMPSERHFVEWYVKTIEAFEISFKTILEDYNLYEFVHTDLDQIYIELKTSLKIMNEQGFQKPFVEFIETQKVGKDGKFLKHRVNYFSSLYQKVLGFAIYERILRIREHIKKEKIKREVFLS